MIDTPTNREYAGKDEDFSTWTPATEFANCVMQWTQQTLPNTNGNNKQKSSTTNNNTPSTTYPKAAHGGFYLFKTQAHKTNITKVDV